VTAPSPPVPPSEPRTAPVPASEGSQEQHRDPAINHLMTALQQQHQFRIYGALLEAETSQALSLDRGTLRVRVSSTTHAKTLQDPASQQVIKTQLTKITGTESGITVEVEGADAEPGHDPTEHPGIRNLFEKYPGKIIVQRKVED